MTRYLSGAVLALTFAAVSPGTIPEAEASFYGAVKLGVTKLKLDLASSNINTQVGLGATGAVGYEFLDLLRVEAEAGYVHNSTDQSGVSGDVSVTTVAGNAFVDIPGLGLFQPYLGAGAGGARVSVTLTGADGDDFVPMWHAMAGIHATFVGSMTFTAEYRYTDTSDATIDGAQVSTTGHSFMAGVRIPF